MRKVCDGWSNRFFCDDETYIHTYRDYMVRWLHDIIYHGYRVYFMILFIMVTGLHDIIYHNYRVYFMILFNMVTGFPS